MRRFVGGVGACPPPDAVWLTVIDWPPTVSVPVRATPVLFAAMLNVTEPMPDPLAPAVIVIQLTGLVAVQGQDVPVVTLSVRLVLSESIEKLVGVTVARYSGGGADSVRTLRTRGTRNP